MSKRKARKHRGAEALSGRRKVILGFVLLASLVSASVGMAHRGLLFNAARSNSGLSAAVAPASLESGAPSKEYIYAGSRLVATEEPQSSCTAPSVPAGVTASAGNAQVTISWGAVSGATSYNVKRSTTSGGPYATVAAGVTATTYTNTSLTNGVIYYYVVSALTGSCESGNSGQVPATPTGGGGTNNASFVSQSVPTSMTAGQTASVSVTMNNNGTTTWSAGTYSLGSQNPPGNNTWGLSQASLSSSVAPGSNATFTFNVTAPAAAGTYNFQWQMQQNGVGYFGALSPNVAVTVGGGGGTNNALFISQSVPTSTTTGQTVAVSVTFRNTGTATSWTPGSYVLRSQNPQGNTTWGLSQVDVPGIVEPSVQFTFSFNITAPATAGTYNFQWQMYKNGVGYFGDLGPNVAISVTSGSGGPPAAPSNLTGQVIGTSIMLAWDRNSTNETGFNVERKVGAGSFAPLVTTTATGYSDKNLSAGTYTYRVKAYNGSGSSAYSNEVTKVIGGAVIPAAPSALVATAASSSQINLTWTDNSNNEDGFKIERKTGTGAFTQVAAVGAGIATYSDTTGLLPSTQYTYQVRAYNGAGDSAYSNTASATTSAPAPPTSPSDLTASAFSSSQVNLAWIDNSNNEESFKIERKTGAGAYAEIGSVGAGTTTYSDTTVAASTTYTYRVRAYNSSGGYSSYSNEAPATTPASETVLLADDFNNNLLDTSKWSISVLSGTQDATVAVAETNQRFEMGPLKQNTSGSHYNGILSVNAYNLTGAYAYVQAVVAPPTNTTADLMFTLPVDDSNHYRVFVEAGVLKFEKKVAGTKTTIGSMTFDSVNHAFWRIRHNSSTDQIIFETAASSGGVPGTWTAQQTLTREIALTSIKVELKAGTFQAETVAPGTVAFDNIKLAVTTPSNPAPTVTAISPNSGSTAGGTSVTITGTGFSSGATLSIGGAAATSVSVVSSTSITATTPAHAAGTVSVIVTNTGGQSGTLANGFTYGAPPAPTVTAISPASGPATGSTSVTITGTGFSTGATASIGGTAATNVTVVSSTAITATTPAHAAGAADVVVTNADNQSGTLTSGFTYTAAETVLLADDFNATSLDTAKWVISILSGTQDTSIGLTQTGGRLQIGPLLQGTANSHYNGISSASDFDMSGAYAYAQLLQGPASNTTGDAMFTMVVDLSNHYRIYLEAGLLKFEKKVAGTKTTISSITFNAASHAFWRIRHNSATDQIVFETAPNNSGAPGAWTAQQTVAREISVSSMRAELKAGTWQVEANAPGTVLFDNFKLARP